MATLAELEDGLQRAYAAGRMDLARVLGAEIVRARQDVGNLIPGAQVPQPRADESGMGEKIVGAGEAGLSALTGATSGMVGMVGGAAKGLAQQVMAGNFGTRQGADAIEKAAAQGMAAGTYAPRTEAGQDIAASIGEAAQGLMIPAVPVALQAPAGAMRAAAQAGTTAAAAGVSRAAQIAAPAVKKLTTAATSVPRRMLESISSSGDEARRMGSAGAAGSTQDAQRVALAESLGMTGDAALTKGQATRSPAQLKFEVETAKLPAEGAALRERNVAQNAALYQRFDQWIDEAGLTVPRDNLRAVGTVVDSALQKQYSRDKTAVNVAYAAARKSEESRRPVDQAMRVALGEGDDAITGTPLEWINQQPSGLPNTGLVDAARQFAVRLGVADMRDGQLVPKQGATIRQMEDWRAAVNAQTGYEPADIRQSSIIKALIDGQTEPTAGPLYRQARNARTRLAQNFEDHSVIAKLLNEKRGTTDRTVALEDVFDHVVIKGSLDDMRQARRVLQRTPDGAQAWNEVRGAAVQWVRDQAFRRSATDASGQRVISADALDKAIRQLDSDQKLEALLGKRGAQQMRDIAEFAQVVRTVPPEAAVNASNTAMTLLAALTDTGMATMTGVPAPVATMARFVNQHVKDKALKKRIQESLNYTQRQQ